MGRNENAAVHGRRKKMIRYGIPSYAMREKLTRKKEKNGKELGNKNKDNTGRQQENHGRKRF